MPPAFDPTPDTGHSAATASLWSHTGGGTYAADDAAIGYEAALPFLMMLVAPDSETPAPWLSAQRR